MARRTATNGTSSETEALLAGLRRSIEGGERHWFATLLEGVGQWPVAEEEVDGRRYRYLVAGEAFDWLLLAERLCLALSDILPEDERRALLVHGRIPIEITEEEFRRMLGPAKHRAHLNFIYGVQVEEALQLRVTDEVRKERLCQVWQNGHLDEEVCRRIYGAGRRELFDEFRAVGQLSGESLSLNDLHEFTYWLFKRRVNGSDPARVASDTRKGLAMLAQVRAAGLPYERT
jgi:hypothetical protein